MLPKQGVWVRSLVRELRSHRLHGMANREKLEVKSLMFTYGQEIPLIKYHDQNETCP